jgi:hypothetical protein
VTVRSRPAPGAVQIDVIDEGCGVDPAIRDKIFDPFFTTKPVGKGTGLGLSISYGIVHSQGGRIELDSAPGKGARFSIILPLKSHPNVNALPGAGGAPGSQRDGDSTRESREPNAGEESRKRVEPPRGPVG